MVIGGIWLNNCEKGIIIASSNNLDIPKNEVNHSIELLFPNTPMQIPITERNSADVSWFI